MVFTQPRFSVYSSEMRSRIKAARAFHWLAGLTALPLEVIKRKIGFRIALCVSFSKVKGLALFY